MMVSLHLVSAPIIIYPLDKQVIRKQGCYFAKLNGRLELEATFPEKGPCQLARPAAITDVSVRLLNQNLKSLLKKETSYKDPAVLLFAAVRFGASASLHVEVLRNELKIMMEIKYCRIATIRRHNALPLRHCAHHIQT